MTFVVEFPGKYSDHTSLIQLDVYDNNSDRILVSRYVCGVDVTHLEEQFTLFPAADRGQSLEFRIFWFQVSDIVVKRVEVRNVL